MIYTPNRYPKQALIMIAIIVIIGVSAGMALHPYFMVVALLFWMQYTAVLSYKQFKRGSRKRPGITGMLLRPQIRFFLFEFIGTVGILSILMYDSRIIGAAALVIWLAFALNFYAYYRYSRK